jgi:hypothetical protein
VVYTREAGGLMNQKTRTDELGGRGDRALIRELFKRVAVLEDKVAELAAAVEAKPKKERK